MSDFSTVTLVSPLTDKDHGGVSGYKKYIFVGDGGYKKQILVRKHDCKSGGEQHFVGVGGLQSSVGAGVGVGVRGDGGKDSRHGGMVARCSHINMHRLLIDVKRCMLSEVPSKLIDMKKKVSFNSFVGCVGRDFSQPINNNNKTTTIMTTTK